MKFEALVRMRVNQCAARGHRALCAGVCDEESGRYLLLRPGQEKRSIIFPIRTEPIPARQGGVPPWGPGEGAGSANRAQARADRGGKPDSQEICFIPDGDYAAFVERYMARCRDRARNRRLLPAGQIVDTEGRVLGVHPGIHRYTVGQTARPGIANSAPLYVLELRPAKTRLLWESAPNLAGSSAM